MKTLKSISAPGLTAKLSKVLIVPAMLCATAFMTSAQGYYDDDLYYDASKAKKESPKAAPTKTAKPSSNFGGTTASASGMYYYDGAAYVPWDSVGDFRPADSYLPTGSSTRDVDEYNRRGSYLASQPDSISLQDFEEMSATEQLARFGNSQVAKDALASQDGITTENYADIYNAGYSSGYDAGYNAGPQTALSINFGAGYPYGYYSYYNTWGWPYYSWRNPCNWYNPWWGWDYYYPAWSWGWGWGWTSPSWGWGYPGYYPGYYPGHWAGVTYRPSPSAAHRPRSTGYNYGAAGSRGGRYDHAVPGSSSRPGYRPPASANGGYYGGSSTGRNSHFGTGSAGYRPSGGYRTGNSGATRPSGNQGTNYNRNNFGSSQSTRNGSFNNNNSNRSGSYSPSRSSGGFSGGGRSGGYSGGGRSGGGGGGGHRSR